MNSTPSFHSRADELVRLDQLRHQIVSDMEMLRAQEENLRRYEMQLRGSQPPMPLPAALQQESEAEREKLARLRALLEAERRALVDERLLLREEKAALAQRTEELKQREAWLELREREAAAKNFAPPPEKKPASSAPFGLRLGLTEVPFAGYFRSQRRSA